MFYWVSTDRPEMKYNYNINISIIMGFIFNLYRDTGVNNLWTEVAPTENTYIFLILISKQHIFNPVSWNLYFLPFYLRYYFIDFVMLALLLCRKYSDIPIAAEYQHRFLNRRLPESRGFSERFYRCWRIQFMSMCEICSWMDSMDQITRQESLSKVVKFPIESFENPTRKCFTWCTTINVLPTWWSSYTIQSILQYIN